jgi:4-hydroxybenzoate polyprenyltransferase
MNLIEIFISIVKVTRPRHIVKNFALFAAIIFSGLLLVPGYLNTVVWAFIAFSFATSATYIFNDIMDIKEDRIHPIKKHRPIAAKKLPVPLAIIVALFCIVIALLLASALNLIFVLTITSYLLLQFVYSLGLKNIAVLDILIIASGFILRVYGGAVVIDAHLSVWFLLCVVSVALFLASGKRRA